MIRKSKRHEVYFEDEVHFQRTTSIIRSWYLKGTTPEIKSPSVKEKTSLFGAMGADNGQLVTMETNQFDALSFRRFLERILKKVKTRKKIFLVLDNARFHHAKINKVYLRQIKSKLELLFLPAYSPELNPIESLWKKTRRSVTHNRYFESKEEQRDCLRKFFNKFKLPNKILTTLSANIKDV